MKLPYNQLAGQSVERLAALSDGIFAVAMTLLVLELHVPGAEAIHSEHDLWQALLKLAPRLLVYCMSFVTLGIFWNGQQVQLSHMDHADRNFTWIQIGFLAVVCLIPFSTALLGQYIHYRLALLLYWLNILVLGVVIFSSWRCAVTGKLMKEDLPYDVRCAVERRIIVAQALYAFGAALCIIHPYWSIAFIVLIQLNFAFAPRIRWLSWI